MKKGILVFLAVVVLVLIAFVAKPALFLASVWWHDPAAPIAAAPAGTNDASRLNENRPAEVVAIAAEPAAAERQLGELVRRAAATKSHIAISGAHHSMGGHTLYPGAIVLDMLPFNRMSLDEKKRILTVGSGARWSEVIPYLDHRGFAVAIMQSNNDFSVGGSLSVNCHGWQNDSPPIASTVDSFRLLAADGSIKRCSRTENAELFSLALGGYGLIGVILEADLRVVPNEFYRAEAHRVKPADYNRVYHELTRDRTDIGMAYGRISVAPDFFFREAVITLLKRETTGLPVADTLHDEKPSVLNRAVFRSGVESDYGKNLRWWLETTMGETGGEVLSRNQIMNEPASLYANRDPARTDILHEYFIPASRLGEFVEKARPVFLKHHPDLLNVTVRNVETDRDSFLRYARSEVFGLVMLFDQRRDAAAEAAMEAFTRELVDVALACGGTYYLPYRAHATREQFLRGYPQAPEFFALKKRYDPAGVFENQFFLNYGKSFGR
ncbi:MAG: FAD-binding oxidoreductase [Chthoniobacterales bacterium]